VNTSGPGDAGSITIVAQGHDANAVSGTERVEGNVTVSESLVARGADALGADEDGGGGGGVQVFAVDGSIQIGPGGGPAGTAVIDTSGGDGGRAGGFAGFIVLDAEGIEPLGAIHQGDPSDPLQPGRDLLRGDVTVNGSVVARGGTAGSDDGGDGGFTQLAARVGSVTVTGSIDASGGDGQRDGGDAAAISVTAEGVAATAPDVVEVLDPDGEVVEQTTEGTTAAPGNVTVAGDIVSIGGAGTDGIAGDGGGLDQAVRDVVISTLVGSASVGAIDISGGDGKTGGKAGRLLATTQGAEDPTPEEPGDGFDAVSGDLTIGTITAIGGDASGPHQGDEQGTPLFRAGAGGTIGVQSLDGTTAVAGVDTTGGDGERGGAGGTVVIESRGTGDVGVGAIVSRGGDGVAGTCTDCGDRSERGGDGGTVGITAWDDGSASVTSIVADGGQGADGGGDGGDINVAATGEESGVGDVSVQGTLSAGGGASDKGGAEDGLVFLRAIGSVLGNVGVAGDLAVDATRMGTSVDDRLEITAAGGADLSDHTLLLFNDGDAAVGLGADTFGTLDVTHRNASGDVDVALAGGGWVRAEKQQTGISLGEDGTTPIFGKSRLSADTASQPIDLSYRLEDPRGETEPNAELEIGSLLLGGNTEIASLDDVTVPAGSIEVPNDSTLTLRADSDRDGVGDLVASSDGIQIASAGDVTLDGVTIGADRVFQIQRAQGSTATDRILRLSGNGDMDVAVTDPLFATIAVDQFNTDGSIDVAQGADVIHVGPAVDDVISDVQINTLATHAGVVLRIEDRRTNGAADPGRELVLPSQGVFLGGDSSFANPGHITLGDGDGVAVTVREGATLGLESENGAIRNGVTGTDRTAISMSADGTGAGGLILEAGTSVGSAGAPIEVQGIGDLAGAADQGSFLVTNHMNGTTRVTEIRHPEPGRTVVRGIVATDRVELVDTESNNIVLAETFEADDISAGTGVLLDGAVLVEDDASVVSIGGGIRFTSTVDADADTGDGAESLHVSTQGPIEWAGQIGSQQALGDLVSNGTTTTLEPATSVVRTTGSQTFGGDLEGGNVQLEAGGVVTFGGDIGAESPLVRLEVRTPDAVEFTGAERVRAEEAVLLKPDGRADVSAEADIYKLDGDLAFETSEFRIGEREKFSVGGNLEIRADSARFGDISAGGLRVDAPLIELLAREAGPAYTTSGDLITDNGLDILGNELVLSSTPVIIDIDPTSDAPVVTLASQSGTVIVPDLTGFEVRLIDQEGGGVTTGNLTVEQIVDGTVIEKVVDLVATGNESVGESARVLPPDEPAIDAWVGPSFGGDQPALSSAAPVADEVLAYLQCSDLGSGAASGLSRCLAPVAAGESTVPTFDYRALQTERARDAALLYRELMGSNAEVRSGRDAFDAALDSYRRDRGSDDVDGAALYQFMEGSGYADAVRYVDELAHLMTQLQLLDLAPAEAQRLRENLAREFAQALEPSGLEADTLLDVIDASRVGLPR
jgi:hypothetical protein